MSPPHARRRSVGAHSDGGVAEFEADVPADEREVPRILDTVRVCDEGCVQVGQDLDALLRNIDAMVSERTKLEEQLAELAAYDAAGVALRLRGSLRCAHASSWDLRRRGRR